MTNLMLFSIVALCIVCCCNAADSGAFDFGKFFAGNWTVSSSILEHESNAIEQLDEGVDYVISENDAGGLLGK
jgi:hypothetical protein